MIKRKTVLELDAKYAPILRFNQGEQFFPMRVDDMLAYSSLYAKDQSRPIVPKGQVTPAHLQQYGHSADVFLRAVQAGPLLGQDVVAGWGKGTLEMVYRWATTRPDSLAERLARKAYRWFSPKTMAAAYLFWWNDIASCVLEEALHSVEPGKLPRLILPKETQDSAIEQYRSGAEQPPPYAYYYRQVQDGHYLCMQYWFFYSYNNWGQRFSGMNDHEGDWECMMLFFRLDRSGRPQEPPAYVTFADHDSRQTKPWDHKDVTRVGNHPVGFVAGGSHATYPEAKAHVLMAVYDLVDYATGDGVTIDHDEWQYRIDLDTVPWLSAYKGSWGTRFWLRIEQARTMLQAVLATVPFGGLIGLQVPSEVELPGVSAPRGPVGPHRPQSTSPVDWAGVPED